MCIRDSLIADGVGVVARRGDQEIQRLHPGVPGALEHDVKEFPVWPVSYTHLKKVGGSGKGCHVGPFLTAVPAFPVSAYLCHGHIMSLIHILS